MRHRDALRGAEQRAGVTVRPARMLGVIMLFMFGSLLFTLLFDPEDRLTLRSALSLLLMSSIVGVTETWGNYVRVDRRGVTRVNWGGFTHQHIALQDITAVYREDETSWYGRVRPYIVIESPAVRMDLGFNVVYRDGGWPVNGLAEIVRALDACGAPVERSLAADAYSLK